MRMRPGISQRGETPQPTPFLKALFQIERHLQIQPAHKEREFSQERRLKAEQ